MDKMPIWIYFIIRIMNEYMNVPFNSIVHIFAVHAYQSMVIECTGNVETFLSFKFIWMNENVWIEIDWRFVHASLNTFSFLFPNIWFVWLILSYWFRFVTEKSGYIVNDRKIGFILWLRTVLIYLYDMPLKSKIPDKLCETQFTNIKCVPEHNKSLKYSEWICLLRILTSKP